MIIGSKLYRMATCHDSMEWAKEHLATAPDGSVFLADKLTRAKGRGKRVWTFYEGQLAITLLLKPRVLSGFSSEDLPIRINQLNMAISLGIYDLLKEYGVGIKWPNDFIFQHKKVAGILFHLVWENGLPVGLICGFAINVNNLFEESDELFEIATSLNKITGHKIEMRPFYKNLLLAIDTYYKKWLSGNFDEIYKLWRNAQIYMGKPISINQKDGLVCSGRMMQVLPNGDMLLIDNLGKQKIVSFYMVDQIAVK